MEMWTGYGESSIAQSISMVDKSVDGMYIYLPLIPAHTYVLHGLVQHLRFGFVNGVQRPIFQNAHRHFSISCNRLG